MSSDRKLQPFAQVFHSAGVIRVMMSEDNFANPTSFAHKCVDEAIQLLLLFLVWRSGVDYDHFVSADDVAICMSCRRQRRRFDGEKKDARSKLDAPDHSVLGFGRSSKRLRRVLNSIGSLGQGLHNIES